ncbi:hypothetical protein [Actinomadura fibrosa]
MGIDEITAFREGRPDVPAYDPAVKARLRARLLQAEPERAVSGARRGGAGFGARPGFGGVRLGGLRGRWATAGALTAALAVGITVVQTVGVGGGGGGNSAPRLIGPVANAEELADDAARKAAAGGEGTPRPGQWAYVKAVYAQTQEGGGAALFGKPRKLRTEETWRRVDDKRFAVYENGELKVAAVTKYQPTYPYLLSLPSEPAALLARVYKEVDAETARHSAPPDASTGRLSKRTLEKLKEAKTAKPVAPTAEQRNMRAFQVVAGYMERAVLPPRLRAAMYGAMARIPGVRYEARASDITGRPGVTLYRVEEGYLRDEVLIDPKTYAYMGFRAIAVKERKGVPGLLDVREGQILGWSALQRAVLVNGPGKRA